MEERSSPRSAKACDHLRLQVCLWARPNLRREILAPGNREPVLRRPASGLVRSVFLSTCVLLAGCGSYFAPSPTTRAVTADDLTGEWRYQPLGSRTEVSLTLYRDGTFEQKVSTADGKNLAATGSWRVYGHYVDLTGVLVDFRGWAPRGELWSVIDRDESPTGFAILGGAEDPDQSVILRYVP